MADPESSKSTTDVESASPELACSLDLHPLVRFWRDDSGWHTTGGGDLELAEGQLAIDAWNAAIAAAAKIVFDGTGFSSTTEYIRSLSYSEENAKDELALKSNSTSK